MLTVIDEKSLRVGATVAGPRGMRPRCAGLC